MCDNRGLSASQQLARTARGATYGVALGSERRLEVLPGAVAAALAGKGADEDRTLVRVLATVLAVRLDVVEHRAHDVAAVEDSHVKREEELERAGLRGSSISARNPVRRRVKISEGVEQEQRQPCRTYCFGW